MGARGYKTMLEVGFVSKCTFLVELNARILKKGKEKQTKQ